MCVLGRERVVKRKEGNIEREEMKSQGVRDKEGNRNKEEDERRERRNGWDESSSECNGEEGVKRRGGKVQSERILGLSERSSGLHTEHRRKFISTNTIHSCPA